MKLFVPEIAWVFYTSIGELKISGLTGTPQKGESRGSLALTSRGVPVVIVDNQRKYHEKIQVDTKQQRHLASNLNGVVVVIARCSEKLAQRSS